MGGDGVVVLVNGKNGESKIEDQEEEREKGEEGKHYLYLYNLLFTFNII